MRRKLFTASLICVIVLGGWAWARATRPEARRRSALAALEARDMERLQYELLNLTASAELQPYAGLLKGALLISAKQFTAALEHLEVSTAREETRIRALVLVGEALYRMRRVIEAGETWTRVLELAPDDLGANRWLGVAYFDLGASREALHYLEKTASLAPGDGRPHRMMALLYGELHGPQEAAEAYQESLRRDPHQPDLDSIQLELAEALNRLGRSEEALAALDQCPKSADVLSLRAACVYRQGEVDKAAELLDEALSLDAYHVRSLALRGNLLLLRKQPQQAVECLERAVHIAPRDVEILTNLLKAYQSLDHPRAEPLKRVLLETTRLGETYSKLATRAAMDPRDAEVRTKLGSIAVRLEQIEIAKSWFRASLALEPGNQAVAAALLDLGGTEEDVGPMRSAMRGL